MVRISEQLPFDFNLSYCRSVTVKPMHSFSAFMLCCILVCSMCISEILVNRIFSVYLHGKPLTLEQGRLEGVAYFLHV